MKKLLILATLGALAVAGCSSGKGTGNRPPLQLPQASAFKSGTCNTIAEPVLALGRFTHERYGAMLDANDRTKLVEMGDKMLSVHADAPEELGGKIMNVLEHIGYVRIRTGKTYDPQLLKDVETARMELQTTCTT